MNAEIQNSTHPSDINKRRSCCWRKLYLKRSFEWESFQPIIKTSEENVYRKPLNMSLNMCSSWEEIKKAAEQEEPHSIFLSVTDLMNYTWMTSSWMCDDVCAILQLVWQVVSWREKREPKSGLSKEPKQNTSWSWHDDEPALSGFLYFLSRFKECDPVQSGRAGNTSGGTHTKMHIQFEQMQKGFQSCFSQFYLIKHCCYPQ